MNHSKWLNRGMALGLALGLVIGAGSSLAWFQLRDQPKGETKAAPPQPEAQKPEGPKPEGPKPEGPKLAKPPVEIHDPMKVKAQLACRSISFATEAYANNPANPENELPNTLDDLVQPPFGGTSFLRNGAAELLDPWGKRYQMRRDTRADGTEYALVTTTAPDGTPISQFGIGAERAFPQR